MWIYSLIWGFWNGLRMLVGLVVPIFSAAADFRSWPNWLRQTLRLLVLLAILGILFLLQWKVGLPTLFKRQWLQLAWLPSLFLLFCAAVWIGHAMWLVWMTDDDASSYPDIDEAWNEAMRALREADIDIQAVPLYLVLGRPAGGEEHLFQAAGLPFTVKNIPIGIDAPLHVFASKHDGIFVTCAGASRLGSQARMLAITADLLPAAGADDSADMPDEDTTNATIGAAQNKMKEVQRVAQLLAMQRGQEMTEEGRARLAVLDRAGKSEEGDRQTARLEHLCRLIVRDRRPECPVNGLLVLIPCAALADNDDAEKTATDCRLDLHAIWNVFQLKCPMIAMVCDLEKAPGFAEFLEGFLMGCQSEEDRRRSRKKRLGKRFGWGARVEPQQRKAMLEVDTGWIGQGMFPVQIYQNLMRPEKSERETVDESIRRNGRLYRFMGLMRDGERRLRKIVTQGLESREDGPALLGGCYLAATGSQPAFVAGVLQRLLEERTQSFVSWTDRALEEDAAYHRRKQIGYIALCVFLAVAVAGLLALWKVHA